MTSEEFIRALDARGLRRRFGGRGLRTLLALAVGPGVLVMVGENDGPSMLSYATTGATYGIGFFVPFILLTFVMAYVVQEATVRIGIATGLGHAELIARGFGRFWGRFAVADLLGGNLLTLITEFVAIRAGASYFGIPPAPAIVGALALIGGALVVRKYARWERVVLALACANVLFVPAALLAQPDTHAVVRALATWGPLPGGPNAAFWTLVLANVGATVTPWMIFFQQSAVVDKGLTRADLPRARFDTAFGALLAAVVAIAATLATTPLFAHHVAVAALGDGAQFARALQPYLGHAGASLFALGMIEAGLVAAMTISTSSAYTGGEMLGGARGSIAFRAVGIGSIVLAALIVLIPGTPLLALTLTVNVIATLLMAPALLFVLLLANDRALMGELVNDWRGNALGGATILAVSLLGGFYGVAVALPHVIGG
ncbi:MAG TPA: divalent metal cation transporter [Candidatus Limnocylindria bacterium]|nr:divalent metal cation transporter [Candidatus Limnocylindria bacterium]